MKQNSRILVCLTAAICCGIATSSPAQDRRRIESAMRRAAISYGDLAVQGGYVYFYTLDTGQRWGEGLAGPSHVWVQPPGTPTVGLAFVRAYQATKDPLYFKLATGAAEALCYGQMKSGGWTNCIDFDPRGSRVAQYRNGRGRGRNTSSLDDGQTQSAIQLLIQVDRLHQFQNSQIHDAAQFALQSLLAAQYPNGAFPQVWDDDRMPDPPAKKASFPSHDWRTDGRIKAYWDMYTLNDNVAGYVAETLIAADDVYGEPRFNAALRRLGDFLIDAQMPEPQPAWAQQYNYEMQPIWARKFEPPGICGDESQEVIDTLLTIYEQTREEKYLAPIPAALRYLEKSQLTDGQLARYYELKTNRPLYMTRRGQKYTLTYDDSNLPRHYGWKWPSRVAQLRERFERVGAGEATSPDRVDSADVRRILAKLDDQGRWVSVYKGERLVGQAKMKPGARYQSSEQFSAHLSTLARYLRQLQR